jgi:hypothetical protein
MFMDKIVKFRVFPEISDIGTCSDITILFSRKQFHS